jgi:hypothetical protein
MAPYRRPALEARLVHRQAEPVPADQLVVGEPSLQMLADHVDVLELPLEGVAVVDRGDARRIVDRIHHRHREADSMRRGQPEGRPLVQGEGACGGRLRPDLADGLGEEGAARSQVGLGVAERRLDWSRRRAIPRGLLAPASSMKVSRQARATPSAAAASPEAKSRVRGIW